MKKSILIGSASLLAICAPVAAQTTPSQPAADAAPQEDVIVTGVRASLEKAIKLKREADNHIEVISATDIGKLPDKNVADALQRLPGVNTSSAASGEGGFDENDRVSIRGTSPSLTNVTIDGHSVSTGDWFILDQFSTVGRSTSFSLLPSEIVSAVVVNKTQDASLLEGGAASSIDLRLRSALDLSKSFVFEAGTQAAYNTQAHKTKPQGNALIGWHNDADTFGVIVQGFYEQRSLRRYGQETLGYSAIAANSVTGKAIPSLVGVQAPTLIGSAFFSQKRTRKGGVTTVDWKANDKLEFKASGFYSFLNASNVNNNYLAWGSREIERNVPTSYTVKNNTLVAATFPLKSPEGTGQFGGMPIEGIVADNIVRPNASGESYFGNLDFTYKATDRLTINGQVGYTHGVGKTPSSPFFEVDAPTGVSWQPSGNGYAVQTADIDPGKTAGVSNDFAINETFTSTDKETYGKLDGSYDLNEDGPIKKVDFGARIAAHERKVVGFDRGCTLGSNGACFGPGLLNFSAVNPRLYPKGFNAGKLGIPGLLIPLAGDPKTITNVINAIPGGVRGPISAIVQPENEYWPGEFTVKETDAEGYAMAHVGGEHWRGNFGLRVVSTKESSFVNSPVKCAGDTGVTCSANVIVSSAYGPYVIQNVKHTYVDYLPSVNLTFDLSDKLALRVAASETMSRPDFSALGGSVSLTDTNFTGSGGNPNLKPIKATVFDGSLEYYYGPASLVSLSLFHDDLQSYVTFGTSVGNYFTQLDGKFHDYVISSPSNTSGKLSGVELQIQQPIAYGFGFQANGTYVSGHEASGAPLVGTSKYTYNLVGYYDKGPLNARLAYTYRSHYFVGLDRSSAENQENYGQLDGSIAFNVTKQVSLNIDALNLTNNRLKYYAANKDQPRAVYVNGTQVFFGARVKF